jgi:hypothetical protein
MPTFPAITTVQPIWIADFTFAIYTGLTFYRVAPALTLAGCGVAVLALGRVADGRAGVGNVVAFQAQFRVAAGAVAGGKLIAVAGNCIALLTIWIRRIADVQRDCYARRTKKRLHNLRPNTAFVVVHPVASLACPVLERPEYLAIGRQCHVTRPAHGNCLYVERKQVVNILRIMNGRNPNRLNAAFRIAVFAHLVVAPAFLRIRIAINAAGMSCFASIVAACPIHTPRVPIAEERP